MAQPALSNTASPEVLALCGITAQEFKDTGLDWSVLEKIQLLHQAQSQELSATAAYVSKRLLTLPAVHSVKVRVKDASHLAAKIIRKKLKSPELSISPDDYPRHITDLVGVRALHLLKTSSGFAYAGCRA